jgi:hypothetical protein
MHFPAHLPMEELSVSEMTEIIDGLTGELERFREMHAETLIAHTDMCSRLSSRIRGLEAELALERRARKENRSPVALALEDSGAEYEITSNEWLADNTGYFWGTEFCIRCHRPIGFHAQTAEGKLFCLRYRSQSDAGE